jgi:hypothetical protein
MSLTSGTKPKVTLESDGKNLFRFTPVERPRIHTSLKIAARPLHEKKMFSIAQVAGFRWRACHQRIPHDVDLISIMPDGKRTLATRPVGQHSASPMGLVLNWQHLLR